MKDSIHVKAAGRAIVELSQGEPEQVYEQLKSWLSIAQRERALLHSLEGAARRHGQSGGDPKEVDRSREIYEHLAALDRARGVAHVGWLAKATSHLQATQLHTEELEPTETEPPTDGATVEGAEFEVRHVAIVPPTIKLDPEKGTVEVYGKRVERTDASAELLDALLAWADVVTKR